MRLSRKTHGLGRVNFTFLVYSRKAERALTIYYSGQKRKTRERSTCLSYDHVCKEHEIVFLPRR